MSTPVSLRTRAIVCALLITTLFGLVWEARTRPSAAATPAATDVGGATPDRQILVVGDSLAVGLKPYLGGMLSPGTVTWDAKSGRTTPQGLVQLRARLREVRPDVVVISLGTNDGWDPARFTSRIRRALSVIPRGACVVWADIYRPSRKGPYRALNTALRAEAERDGRIVVVDWLHAVKAGEVTLPDGLHPDHAGFRLRSRLFARAIANHC
jgi:lysophospholipase L1-like esterase